MLALAVYISCFLYRFHWRLVANANPISSGIWALVFILCYVEEGILKKKYKKSQKLPVFYHKIETKA